MCMGKSWGDKADDLQLFAFPSTVIKYWERTHLRRSLTSHALLLPHLYPGVCSSVQVFLQHPDQMLLRHILNRKFTVELAQLCYFSSSKPSQKSPSAKSLPALLRPTKTHHGETHPLPLFQDLLILFNTVQILNFLVRPGLWSLAFNPEQTIFVLSKYSRLHL